MKLLIYCQILTVQVYCINLPVILLKFVSEMCCTATNVDIIIEWWVANVNLYI